MTSNVYTLRMNPFVSYVETSFTTNYRFHHTVLCYFTMLSIPLPTSCPSSSYRVITTRSILKEWNVVAVCKLKHDVFFYVYHWSKYRHIVNDRSMFHNTQIQHTPCPHNICKYVLHNIIVMVSQNDIVNIIFFHNFFIKVKSKFLCYFFIITTGRSCSFDGFNVFNIKGYFIERTPLFQVD